MREVKAPGIYKWSNEPVVFLGGSIEMGVAEKWQDRIVNDLSKSTCLILNPRRDDWDASWVQDPTKGTKFWQQVSWELQGQEVADIICYYFDPNTKSPITLLELGLFGQQTNVLVCCPKEFWRYGNVAMVCNRYQIPLVHSYEEMSKLLKNWVDFGVDKSSHWA